MRPLTEEELAEMDAIHAAASPLDWEIKNLKGCDYFPSIYCKTDTEAVKTIAAIAGDDTTDDEDVKNAIAIVMAMNAYPHLVAEIRALRAALSGKVVS